MGDRALVAYEREAGYDLHRSQWGAQRLALRWRVTPATPFGGGSPPPVDPAPTMTAVETAEFAAAIDPAADEAFYLVDREFEVQSFVVARLDVPDDAHHSQSVPGALVVPPNTDRDGCRLRARIDGVRSTVRALVGATTTHGDTGDRNTPRCHCTLPVALLRRAIREGITAWASRTIALGVIDDETF